MMIWHKRLFIFLSKILGVIILLVVIALFLYYNYFFKKDNLIKYIPQEAVFYSTFRLNNDINDNQLILDLVQQLKTDYHLPEIDYKILNQFIGYNSAFALLPKTENKNLSFDYLLIFDVKEQKQQELKGYLEFLNNHNWQSQVLKINALEKNILIVSNSDEVLNKVMKISFQQESALGDDINLVLNLSKIKLDNIAKIYIDIEELTNHLSNINNSSLKLAIASFETNKIKELYFGLKSEDNKLYLSPINENDEINTKKLLLNKIPANFAVNTNFINGKDNFLNVYEILRAKDPVYWQNISNNINYYQGMLDFNFNIDILELFEQNAQIIIDKQNNYIIALEIDKEANFSEKINKLEQILIEYLAINNPQEKSKQLPDYSYIIQLVKNSDSIIKNQENIARPLGANISLITLKTDNIEFSYYLNENQLILANSRQILVNMINNIDLISIDSLNCSKNTNLSPNGAHLGQNLIIKGDYLSNLWLGMTKINNLVFSQDNNTNIWLCLD